MVLEVDQFSWNLFAAWAAKLIFLAVVILVLESIAVLIMMMQE